MLENLTNSSRYELIPMHHTMENQKLGFILDEVHTYIAQKQIHTVFLRYDNSRFSAQLFEQLNVMRPKNVETSVIKRQSEFLAGRYAASQALNALGIPNVTLGVGKHRNPIWPDNIIGSITHSLDIAICSISSKLANDFLGIDIEKWLSHDKLETIKTSIVSDEEEQFLRNVDSPFEQAITIAFSAKESLFKALYPRVGEYFGFDAARITGLDLSQNAFTLTLTEDLANNAYLKGTQFHGQIQSTETWVKTMVAGSLSRSKRVSKSASST